MMKRKLYIFAFFALIITISLIVGTLAVFETNATGDANMDIGKFVVKINGTNIIDGSSKIIRVNNFVYTDNDHVEDGYIAPGREGYFDIVLDVTDSDVAARYDITFDLTNDYADNINYYVTSLNGSDTVKTGESTYSGVVSLDDITAGKTITLRINVSWDNDVEYDEEDTELGLQKNNSISIPVVIKASQYMGETITPEE